jgi:hypothetical protein
MIQMAKMIKKNAKKEPTKMPIIAPGDNDDDDDELVDCLH